MAGTQVRMEVEWAVPSGQAGRIAEALQYLMLTTRRQHGCLGCSLSTEAGERVTLHYLETWGDEDDLKRQVRSERFTALAGLVEAANDPPRIEFALPAGTRGIDYATEVREES